jgi:radical SAM superfamily enzyme YgiQ (UPF0313 family)
MKLRVLLVNPWIYDFAAANVWARPLGLLRVAECLSRYDLTLSLIDCTYAGRPGAFGRGKFPREIVPKPDCLKSVPRHYARYGITPERFRHLLAATGRFDIVFMTSAMSYWYPGVRKAIRIIREMRGDVPIVLGGIYATLWHGHASAHSGADFIHRGPVNEAIRFVFNTFGYRLKESGETAPWHRLGLYRDFPFAPVMTGEGCPFQCSYCASRLLVPRFTQRDPRETAAEIKDLHAMGVRDFVFYDDALLVNAGAHIKILLREVLRLGIDTRFHCPNGLHARFIDRQLARLMKSAGFRTIRLGFETSDAGRQNRTGEKVNSNDLVRAVRLLKGSGFTKNDIGVYLMYGLPEQPLEEVRSGVEFLKSLGVEIRLSEFTPIPATGAWKELIEGGIIADDIDPLLTNNTVFSFLYAGYDSKQLEVLKGDVKVYNSGH